MTLLLAALLAVCPSRADAALLRGVVKARPRVARPADGGEYSGRALHYAVPFDYGHLKNAVVYAESADARAPGGPSAGGGTLRLVQTRRGLAFEPAFLAVPAGSELVIENASGRSVTLFAGGSPPSRLALSLAPGRSGSARVSGTGLYLLRCLEAPEAAARLFAAGSAAARVEASGAYALELPAGRYRVTAWHERLPPRTAEIEVAEGAARTLDFELAVSGLPEVP